MVVYTEREEAQETRRHSLYVSHGVCSIEVLYATTHPPAAILLHTTLIAMDNELIRVWQLVHELSEQLALNQSVTETLQLQAKTLKVRAHCPHTTPERGIDP
jgi:hypothetical protein